MKFSGQFNPFQAFRLFSHRIVRIACAPFQMFYRRAVRLLSPNNLMLKMSEDIRGGLKRVGEKPTSLNEYVLVGERYVAKKLLLLAALLFIIAVSLTIRFGYPWIQARFLTRTMVINTEDMGGYTGKVRLVSGREPGTVLFEGRLEDGRINGPGTLYGYDGVRLYRGRL